MQKRRQKPSQVPDTFVIYFYNGNIMSLSTLFVNSFPLRFPGKVFLIFHIFHKLLPVFLFFMAIFHLFFRVRGNVPFLVFMFLYNFI